MRGLKISLLLTSVAFILTAGYALSGEVGNLIQFQPNTTARSSEVNQNFSRIRDAVNDNFSLIQQLQQQVQQLQQQVQQLQQQIQQLQNRLASVESNTVLQLDGKVYLTDGPAGTDTVVRFEGVNVQIVNGQGSTDTTNGLGNLIVGYDEERADADSFTARETCSLGQYWNDQTQCEANNGTWGKNFKTGSHNIIVGGRNAYSAYGGIVSGFLNVINSPYASVPGGINNIASGHYSSVSGGFFNTASGSGSSVSGGSSNTASGTDSSVSGGYNNTASGSWSSVSGGSFNTASGIESSVSGGYRNTASGTGSSVSGGSSNTASGSDSSVSGGYNNTASGNRSSVSGGSGCSLSNTNAWGAKTSGGTNIGDCP